MSDENNKINGAKENQNEKREDTVVITKADKAGEEERKKERKSKKQASSLKWALLVLVFTFFITLSFSVVSKTILDGTNVVVAIVILSIFIVINIVFDIIAVAVTACSYEPYLAMASKRIYGAKLAVKIAKNAEKVASICGDVVGDVCGIISGVLGASIVAILIINGGGRLNDFLLSILFSSSIAAITVGGKAIGKKFAIDKCQKIVFFIARLLSVFSFKKGK